MEDGRVVDTLYFGTFGKASTLISDFNAGDYFVYCPGPKAVLKLVENAENHADLCQSVLDERLSAISVSQIATEANLSVETVTNLLAGVRDEVVDLVVVKN